ncbi:MAG: MacB-like periplasmic core domain protein [Gemmatimonadetes bacterium]|nr:MacB-like periplasmic core domain protein [Gemmatimonadota bacterium]
MQFEVLQIALSALRANLLRSLLTMLGIVIGVAAVIAMIALGDGAQQSVRDRIANLGTTLLQIDAQRVVSGGVQTQVTKKMTIADVQAIEERAPHVAAVQAQQDKNLQLVWGSKNTNITINGVSPNFLVVRKFEIDRGTMFTSADNIGRQRVAVLGAGALTLLGVQSPDDIIGEKVRIGGIQFVVIGTLKAKGAGSGFGSPDDQVIIPFETSRYRVFKTDKVDDIYALAATEADLPDAMAEIGVAMRRAHRLRQGDQDDFRVRNQADFLQTLGETTAVFTTLLAGIAAVSLLVGGIGIMNIMLVSVTERTREIGIRKALGATKRNILFQFLIEAVTLCLLGGAIGIAAGVGGAVLLRNSFGWSTAIGASSIVMAFVFAAGVGILFGVWPARRASSLDPIEALRYE